MAQTTHSVSVFCVVSKRRVVVCTALNMMSPGWWRRSCSLGKCPSLIHSHIHSLTLIHSQTHSSQTVYEKQNVSLCVRVSQGDKKSSIGLQPLPPEAHHLQLLNALYRPIEMLLIQRRPMSSKMADQILLKRQTSIFTVVFFFVWSQNSRKRITCCPNHLLYIVNPL